MFGGGEGIYGLATNGNSYAAINATEAAQFAKSAEGVIQNAINGLVQRSAGHLTSDMRSALSGELQREFGKVSQHIMKSGGSAADVTRLFRSPKVVDSFVKLTEAMSRSSHGSELAPRLAELRQTVHELSGYKSVGQRAADSFQAAKQGMGSAVQGVKQNATALANRSRQFAANGRAALAGAGAGAAAVGQAAVTVGSMEVGSALAVGGGASVGGVTATGAAVVGGAVVLAGGVGYAIGTGVDYIPSIFGGRNLSDYLADGAWAIKEFVTGSEDEEIESDEIDRGNSTPPLKNEEEPQTVCMNEMP
jgi:hypothetical protein